MSYYCKGLQFFAAASTLTVQGTSQKKRKKRTRQLLLATLRPRRYQLTLNVQDCLHFAIHFALAKELGHRLTRFLNKFVRFGK